MRIRRKLRNLTPMIRRLQTLAWDGRFLLRGLFDVLRWPFERIAWAFERAVVWPLGKLAGRHGVSLRTLAFGGLGLLAVAALALGAMRLSEGDGEQPIAVTPVAAPVESVEPASAPVEPTLQGAVPDFTPEADGTSAAKVADADTVIASKPEDAGETASTSAATASSSNAPGKAEDPGPAAIEVARRFSDAFVLYETGNTDPKVREAFAATATPQLTKALLRRPPRLPADVEVPKAKVLNVVPGPRQGDTFTLSASLLRVGITSELRIDVQRQGEAGEWQVTDVLG